MRNKISIEEKLLKYFSPFPLLLSSSLVSTILKLVCVWYNVDPIHTVTYLLRSYASLNRSSFMLLLFFSMNIFLQLCFSFSIMFLRFMHMKTHRTRSFILTAIKSHRMNRPQFIPESYSKYLAAILYSWPIRICTSSNNLWFSLSCFFQTMEHTSPCASMEVSVVYSAVATY